jgi:cysteine synthase
VRRVLGSLLIAGIATVAGACTLVGGSGGTGGTLEGTSWRLTDYVSSGTLIAVEPGYIVDATRRRSS